MECLEGLRFLLKLGRTLQGCLKSRVEHGMLKSLRFLLKFGRVMSFTSRRLGNVYYLKPR